MARFTDQQIDDARRTDLVSFLRSRGEKLVRSGREYRWVYRDANGEHDSVTVRDGEWYCHKRGIGGDAIGFLQEYYDMDFHPAVAMLLDLPYTLPMPRDIVIGPRNEQVAFERPPKADNMHRLYAYLCKTRGLAPEVVTHFVQAGILYEDAKYHNAVFIATDNINEPRGGMKKSTLSGSGFRQTVAGSDTRYAFHHKGSSGKVYVFEGAVDMLSFISLHSQEWQKHSYLALDGVSPKPLLHFLHSHDDIREVCLCLDNDEAGINAANRITAQLTENGYTVVSVFLPTNKDWNDDLKAHQEQAHGPDPPQPELAMTM